MKHMRLVMMMIAGLAVSACASVDTASRNAPLETPQMSAAIPSLNVQSYSVKVPRGLRVSEANMYYPLGDIVWREDPIGDRHAQVAALFETGMKAGIEGIEGALPVLVDIEVTRFHALTEKTRYTVGGVHSIKFNMTVRDPATDAVILPTREISADLKGYGGARALAAERQGRTQKVRITHHLANVIRQELMMPGSTGEAVTELVAGLETATNF